MLKSVLQQDNLRLTVIAPNTHFHWPIAMPRVILPDHWSEHKAMFELYPFFKDYPPERFEFVLGAASSMDLEGKHITVALNRGGVYTVHYDTLVIATGSTAQDHVPWTVLGTTEETKDKLHALWDDIRRSETIVIAGGGPTGTETAGEIAYEYNGGKEVHFVYYDDLPLGPSTLDSVRKQVVKELSKLKVNLLPKTRVTEVTKDGKDTILQLRRADGSFQTLRTQAYIPATGTKPNSAFAPKEILDNRGFIKQTNNRAMYADSQCQHLIKNIPRYLSGGKMTPYKKNQKEMMAVTLGRKRATGQLGNIKILSLLMWYAKGRWMGTDYAYDLAAGRRSLSTVLEKRRW
ncbi:hypothetical protein B0J15DRAFT_513291 [Fusarium solani]|uniref:FAD/NAD(P)-binding domain-containing protein n=1 Tax=Fusarium solani TaxID=169388 RepID=A0A9P9HA73_FUSSL|nr:uncharacterized protein B0J15DRAFT_513291 [Fusarium solani]KAH7252997.1 hypothetical protein B0J15DRAFT_513291 [Fusarium solani]